ncbi:hypothetical protein Tco_0532890 [Tanacetum coccineum]
MKIMRCTRLWRSLWPEITETSSCLTWLKQGKKKKKRQGSPKTPSGSPPHPPPPPPPPAGPSGTSRAFGASKSSQSPPPPPPSSNTQGGQSTSTAAPSSSKTVIGDMATFMDWYCKKQGISELTQKDLEGLAYEIVKVFYPDIMHLQFQMEECHKLLTDQVDDAILRYNVSKPLPLGGDPGHVTIQPDFFFNKDLEYLWYGRKIGRPALSILKIKAAYYPDVDLEQLEPDQIWIEEECKYDVAAMYGISHWWFQRQRFYINRHTSEGDRRAVRTHMCILSVVRIELFPMYGYNYMKKIVLRRADLKEYVIAERDFKYLYPSDFEDLYLDKYGVQMIMRFNEIYKFSDGTLHQIDEALDYRVKEFRVNRRNPGLDTQFWTKKDVDRSKEFMFAIQK